MPLHHDLLRGLDPALTLRTYAHEHGYDRIVIGRRHRGLIQRALTGDVTTSVARDRGYIPASPLRVAPKKRSTAVSFSRALLAGVLPHLVALLGGARHPAWRSTHRRRQAGVDESMTVTSQARAC